MRGGARRNRRDKVSERVLILDDETSILDLLGQFLEGEGHECVLAETATEALEHLNAQPFDLVLTDLGLPDIHGMEVVRRVRQIDEAVGVIVITGHKDVSAAIEAMRAGADDYLTKPFNLGEISVSVSKVLDKRRLVLENRLYQQELEARVREATAGLEQANRKLRETKDYLEKLLQSTSDAIITADLRGRITYCNAGALRMLGYERTDLVDQRAEMLFAGGRESMHDIGQAVQDLTPLENFETEFVRSDGVPVPVYLTLSFVRDADGEVGSAVAICKDTTKQKRLERALREMSIKDSLTGLFNQRYFYDRLEEEIERTRRQKHALSLILLDLDQFKWYNDCFGHLAGDNVLRAVGEVLAECTREHVDAAFRYGGDEFTIILPEADEAQARNIAQRIRATFAARDFERVTMSIGVMEFRPGFSARQFIQSADAMMYEAKRNGGDRVLEFDQEVCQRVLEEAQQALGVTDEKGES